MCDINAGLKVGPLCLWNEDTYSSSYFYLPSICTGYWMMYSLFSRVFIDWRRFCRYLEEMCSGTGRFGEEGMEEKVRCSASSLSLFSMSYLTSVLEYPRASYRILRLLRVPFIHSVTDNPIAFGCSAFSLRVPTSGSP